MNRFFIILIIVTFLGIIVSLIVQPYRVNVDAKFQNYRNGDTIFAVKKEFLSNFGPFKKGDIVLLNNQFPGFEEFALVVGGEGDSGENIFYLPSKEAVGDVVYKGYYLVKFPSSERTWAISEADIKALLGFPFVNLRLINRGLEMDVGI